MGLFSQEQGEEAVPRRASAPRNAWTRESGTRRLILIGAVLAAAWYGYSRVSDHFLLQSHWTPLAPVAAGLTVVGTLDPRNDYDRNMFKILQMNKSVRVDLTDFGWRTIFDGSNGPMFSDRAANAIIGARDVNDLASYAMLEPYVHAGVDRLLGRADWNKDVRADLPIAVPGDSAKTAVKTSTLGVLIDSYSATGASRSSGSAEVTEGGSASGREVEHGTAIPADILTRTLPVVLTGASFNSASVEQKAPDILGEVTYTLRLVMTPEGRSRFFQWSHSHANESLVFVLNRQVLAAGRVREELDVNDWEIGPLHDGAAARQIADYVNRRGR